MKLYISPEGSDSNIGSKENPLGSLRKAVEMTQGQKGVLLLAEGTYYLKETLLLKPENSGLTIKARKGTKPTISGGIPIRSTWTKFRDNILVCEIPKEITGDQLFVNGKRQTRARFPDSGYIKGIGGDDWPHKSCFFNPSSFTEKKWSNPKGAILHCFTNSYWGNLQWEIDSIDYVKNQIHFSRGGTQINDVMQGESGSGIGARSTWYIENIFEELDAPGEWFLDEKKGKLYLIPEEDINLNGALIELSNNKELIKLTGTQDNPVKDITLSGIRFAHTSTTFLDHYDAPSLGDWTICRKGAVYLEGTKGCHILHCFFDQVGGNSIFFNKYNRRGLIENCLFQGSGDSGICFVGDLYHTIGYQKPYSADMEVSNNHLHDLGVYGKQTAAVFVSVAKRININHNKMHSLPRAAICINDGTWGGHRIEYNDVFDTVKETGDHGPFNSWGRGRFWCLTQSHGPASHIAGDVLQDCREPMVINQNRFEDYSGWGIDLDDGTSNTIVSNNLCIGISVKLREGDYRTVINNIFIKGANPPGFHLGYELNHDRFLRNIIFMDSDFETPENDVDFKMNKGGGSIYKIIFPPAQGKWFEEWDNNLFYNDIGEFKAEVRLRGQQDLNFTLKEWQEKGFDRNSLYADPEFISQEKGNYQLKSSSPASKIGFQPLDYSQFGLINFRNPWTNDTET